MTLTLNPFEDSIKKFLDNLAQEDELFAETYKKPNKSIQECCQYIFQEVEKSRKGTERCVGCSDDEIYGLAIHYYDEDDIKVEGPATKVEAVQTTEPTETKPKATRKKKQAATDMSEGLIIPLF